MKKLIFILLVAISSLASAQSIATVDMDKAFRKYYKTIHAEKSLKKQVTIMEDRAIEMERRHKSLSAEYEALRKESLSILLSEEARLQKKNNASQKQEEIRKIQGFMRSFNKSAQGVLAKQHNTSRQEILKEIKGAVQLVSSNRNFDLILDISGKTSNLIPCVVYSKKELEITSTVLAILNKGQEDVVAAWEAEQKKKVEEKK